MKSVTKPTPAAKPVAVAKAPAAKATLALSKQPVVASKSTPASIARADALAKTSGKPPLAKPPVANGKPIANGKAAPVVAEPPKPPSGRPMLSQGPFVSTALTKKGTFAPNKLVVPPVKAKRSVSHAAPLVATPPPLPPAPAVSTGEKPQKNRAGLTTRDLEFFRDLLLAKRRELLGDMSSMEREALRETGNDLSTLPVHMADQGTDAYEQEFTLGLVEKDRTLLRELNNALAKIQNGSYGICEGTGLPISRPRLEAQPWAKYSIEHARALEKRQMMFRR